jgi:hypothetical protein
VAAVRSQDKKKMVTRTHAATQESSNSRDALRQLRHLVFIISLALIAVVAVMGWLIARTSGQPPEGVFVTAEELKALDNKLSAQLALPDSRVTANANDVASLSAMVAALRSRLTAAEAELEALRSLGNRAADLETQSATVAGVSSLASDLNRRMNSAETALQRLEPLVARVAAIEQPPTFQNTIRGKQGSSELVLGVDETGYPLVTLKDAQGYKRLELGRTNSGQWCFLAYTAGAVETTRTLCDR